MGSAFPLSILLCSPEEPSSLGPEENPMSCNEWSVLHSPSTRHSSAAVQGQTDMLAVAPTHMGGKQPRTPWTSFRRKLYIAVLAKVAVR